MDCRRGRLKPRLTAQILKSLPQVVFYYGIYIVLYFIVLHESLQQRCIVLYFIE